MPETTLTEADVRSRIRAYAIELNGGKKYGSLARLAGHIGTSKAYISYVMQGTRPPNKKLLDLIGVERTRSYRSIRYHDTIPETSVEK